MSEDGASIDSATINALYRNLARRLAGSEEVPPDATIAAMLFVAIKLPPSEFKSLGKYDRIPFLKMALDAKKSAATGEAGKNGAEAGKAKPVGRPRKDRPRATANARMIDEMQRNPTSTDWSLREWAKHLGCSTSAVVKTKSWKMITATRESQKVDRKSRTPRRYEE